MCVHVSECPQAEPACGAALYCPLVTDYEFAYVGVISHKEVVEDGTNDE